MSKDFHAVDNITDADLYVSYKFSNHHESINPTLSLGVSGEGSFGFDLLYITLTKEMVESLVEHLQMVLKGVDGCD